jgi:hypothetical protein
VGDEDGGQDCVDRWVEACFSLSFRSCNIGTKAMFQNNEYVHRLAVNANTIVRIDTARIRTRRKTPRGNIGSPFLISCIDKQNREIGTIISH